MRRSGIVLAVIVLAAPGAGSAAWYVGGGLGWTAYGHDLRTFDDGSLSQGRVDDSDSGWKLYGGYRFLPFFGVEAGFVDLNNDFDSTTTFRGVSNGGGFIYGAGPVSVDIDDPHGFYAAAVGRLPLGSKLAAFAKAGLISWEADVTTLAAGFSATRGDDGVSSMVGVGVEYQILRVLRLRAEWERYAQIVREDIDMISVGVALGLPVP